MCHSFSFVTEQQRKCLKQNLFELYALLLPLIHPYLMFILCS